MLVYILIILLCLLLNVVFNVNKNKIRKRNYLIVMFTLITLISALRDVTVGIDTRQYWNAYQIIGELDWSEWTYMRYEWGFFALCKALNYVSTNPQLLIIISSVIIMPSVGRAIYKYSEKVEISTFLFLSFNYFSLYMPLMRQGIAIAIFLWAIDYLFKGKYIRYCCFIVFASLFHKSALILFILPLLLNKKYTKKIFFTFLLLAIILGSISKKLFLLVTSISIFTKYRGYINTIYANSNYGAALVYSLIALIILCVGYYYLQNNFITSTQKNEYLVEEQEKRIYINLLAYLVSIAFVSEVMVMNMSIIGRVSVYFRIFYLFWIPAAIKNISCKEERMLVLFSLIILMSSLFIIVGVYRPEWYGVVPYRFFHNYQ
ncbi:MAG: EpsG family protein [Clostridiaceae bacterium]